MSVLSVFRGLGQRLGPYLLIELLLPGGSLLVLLLLLYERRKAAGGGRASWAGLDFKRPLMGLVDECRLALQPSYVQPLQTIHSIRRER